MIDIYIVTPGENYPVIDENVGDKEYTVDHVAVISPGEGYRDEDVIQDNVGNVYTKILDTNGKILNVIPPNPATENVSPVKDIPKLTIQSDTGFGAIIKPQIAPRPEYQGKIIQVIDCITPRDGIVGFINGDPYYGSFHVMPNGVKMTGAKHSGNDLIIYDTPQESRTSRGVVASTTSTTPMTTVFSPRVPRNVSNTTTPSQTTTSAPSQTGTTDTSSQQETGQSYTPPDNNNSGGGGSSGSNGSGGGYSGY